MKIKVPAKFYCDFQDRCRDRCPKDHGDAERYALVDSADARLWDLLGDAEYYAGRFAPDGGIGLRKSAEATVMAIRKVIGYDRPSANNPGCRQ